MYAWIFRHLPGPLPLRVLLSLLLLAAVVAACFEWLFPHVAEYLEGGTSVASGSPGV